jgi:hypothetical protein
MSSFTYTWTSSGILDRTGEPVDVTCLFDYTPPSGGLRDEPPEDEEILLEEAWLGDFDIYYLLTEDQVEELVGLALDAMAAEHEQSEFDWAEARADAMRDDAGREDD